METKPWATRGTGRNAQANKRISSGCLPYQRALKSHFTWVLGDNFLGDLKGFRKRRNFILQCCLLFIQFKEMGLWIEPTSLNLREMNNAKYVSWTCRVALSVQMGIGHNCANPGWNSDINTCSNYIWFLNEKAKAILLPPFYTSISVKRKDSVSYDLFLFLQSMIYSLVNVFITIIYYLFWRKDREPQLRSRINKRQKYHHWCEEFII